MTEERITRVEAPGQGAHTHTTIITDEPRRRGTATGLLLLATVDLGVLGLIVFSQMSGAEVAKDTAIADAASQVSSAAGQVGEVAQQAADTLGE